MVGWVTMHNCTGLRRIPPTTKLHQQFQLAAAASSCEPFHLIRQTGSRSLLGGAISSSEYCCRNGARNNSRAHDSESLIAERPYGKTDREMPNGGDSALFPSPSHSLSLSIVTSHSLALQQRQLDYVQFKQQNKKTIASKRRHGCRFPTLPASHVSLCLYGCRLRSDGIVKGGL